MDIKLDVHTGLACSWSVVLIYNRDHGRWSQAECPDWSVQSRVCLMPQYSNASCTKLKSHVLLICEGPQGVITRNVMYIYIYRLRTECEYQALLHSAITFAPLFPGSCPAFCHLHSVQNGKLGPGNKATFWLITSPQVIKNWTCSNWPKIGGKVIINWTVGKTWEQG